MISFKFRWLYRWIRKKTNPIPETKALLWKRRLSLGYALFAWNAFGILLYQWYAGQLQVDEMWGLKTDEELNKQPAEYYADLLGMKRAHIISIKQFNKLHEYDYINVKQE